jgi:hypothetical protein
MKSFKFVAAPVFIAASLFSVAATASPLFLDGFESPSQGGGYSYGGTDSAGASFVSISGLQADGSAFGYFNAPEGVQTAHIQQNGSFTETVTGLVSGQAYALTFDFAARPNYATDGLQVSYGLTSLFDQAPTSDTWTSVTVNFVADGSSVFTFAGTLPVSAGDTNVGVDAVSIAAIPEPSTWAMMLLGFVGLGFLAYRRRDRVPVA